MKIIRYRLAEDITIEFQDEHRFKMDTTYNNFIIGKIKNPYDKSVFGYGYIGEGKHLTRLSSTKKHPYYNIWISMIERCCCEDKQWKHPAYKDCSICDEWLCYQTFADWCDLNYYDIKTERMHIDKDILVNGNRIYSPATCCFVPQRINMIFMEKTKGVDSDLPNTIHRCVKGFRAAYNGKSLGIFKTLDDAIIAHDTKKRINIKNVANEFEGSQTQLSSVLNGKSKTSKMYGLGLLYICDKSKNFNYYFKKIDKC